MADDIEVHYYPQSGELTLWCGDEAFNRLRNVVISEATVERAVGATGTQIRLILIENTGVAPSSTMLRDRLTQVGCILAAVAIFFVLAIGIATIANWFRHQI